MDAATIVKRVRAQSGITRKELAELAELSPSTVGRIEQGNLEPTWRTLSRILEATGYQINGDTVVSAGEPTAIAAARGILELLLTPHDDAIVAATRSALAPASAALDESTRAIARSLSERMAAAAQAVATPTVSAAADVLTEAAEQWIQRWARAGWLSGRADADDLVTLAISAGNAAKISRRNVSRRVAAVDGGWRALVRRLDDAGIDYAVSGLVATRDDRATAVTANPLVYVEDPARVVADLGLEEARPGAGVQLIAPVGNELSRTGLDGGIRFVSRAQGVLDAFAGPGREPDKAEDALRSLLAATV